MDTLAERLRFAMTRAGLDDRTVARDISAQLGQKVAWQTVQSVRTGRSKSSKYILQLARACHVDPEWLAAGKTYAERHPTEVREPANAYSVATIQRQIDDLDYDQRKIIQDLVDYFAKLNSK